MLTLRNLSQVHFSQCIKTQVVKYEQEQAKMWPNMGPRLQESCHLIPFSCGHYGRVTQPQLGPSFFAGLYKHLTPPLS